MAQMLGDILMDRALADAVARRSRSNCGTVFNDIGAEHDASLFIGGYVHHHLLPSQPVMSPIYAARVKNIRI